MVQYHSHGKLLLTGEYTVLDGALALALPTRLGQRIAVRETDGSGLNWESNEPAGSWFRGKFAIDDGRVVFQNNESAYGETGEALAQILNAATDLNPAFAKKLEGAVVNSELEFPRDWGLGSSSTLVHSISQWAQVDPYALLERTFGGSGYDIASAAHGKPVLFQKTNSGNAVQPVAFSPPFKDSLFFVHLNEKAKSKKAVTAYRELEFDREATAAAISAITRGILVCTGLGEFRNLLEKHEAIMASVLAVDPVKKSRFPDYRGTVKSLGAWGGDFILATGNSEDREYFRERGYHTIRSYAEMILDRWA